MKVKLNKFNTENCQINMYGTFIVLTHDNEIIINRGIDIDWANVNLFNECLNPVSLTELPNKSNVHNPDNLSDEMVETDKGYRLLDKDEIVSYGVYDRQLNEIELYNPKCYRYHNSVWSNGWVGNDKAGTYRTKLSKQTLKKLRESYAR